MRRMKCIGTLTFLLVCVCITGSADATTWSPKICLDKHERVVECDPDRRPPTTVQGSLRRFHKAWEQRQGEVTLIDMRNGWFRIMYRPEWVQNTIGDKSRCAVRMREYTDGWGKPEESDLYYYLRITEDECKNVDALAKQAQAYFPFDWHSSGHLACDVRDFDRCLGAEWLYDEAVGLIAEGHFNNEKVEIIGYEDVGPPQRKALIQRFAPADVGSAPVIYIADYAHMQRVACARMANVMVVCGPEKGPIRVMLFQWFD